MELGVESLKLAGRKGVPDRMFLLPGGKPLFIEFKRPGGRLASMQSVVHTRWGRYGYPIEVCCTVGEAFELVRSRLG